MKKADAEKLWGQLAAIDVQCKSLYRERDEVEGALIAAIQAARTGEIKLPNGSALVLRDNFLDQAGRPRNTAFKTTAVKRFEVTVRPLSPLAPRSA